MRIPEILQQAIEEEIERIGFRDIVEAREDLTDRYRQGLSKKQNFMMTEAHRYAYLATRLPATYAAIHFVLEEIRGLIPDTPVKSLLDLGAGPGTGIWAACELFPEIEKITLIEKDPNLIVLGKRLGAYSENKAITHADWQTGDLERLKDLPEHDLILLSYSIGELGESTIIPLLDTCWKSTTQVLVIIEPGTPVGFERIRTIRRHVISLGSHMVAPCPHAVACPMPQGDWCHFSQRLERSSFHRRLKGGTLGHEDEKFSYVAVSKTPCVLPQTRVLRHPLKKSGHVCLTLCTSGGIKQEVISKRNPDAYKIARKLEWGSSYDL
jgi:ribosomal protein RSM22 (predicted rRNA methylase)